MDYRAEYTLFQRNTYGIIQCLHGIQGLQIQASGSRILPFFKGHLGPILEHFNPAFMNRSLQKTNETLIRMYATQIAQQGVWHLQKTIAKLITESLYVNLNMRDKKYIIQGTISKAKKHFGPKLSPTTINNFMLCVENLWENHKCNQQIVEYLRDERGPDWFRAEFSDYLPNVINIPKKANVGLKDTTPNSNKPHQSLSQFPKEYGNLNFRPKRVYNNTKPNQRGPTHQYRTTATSANKDNQHTNTTTNTPNRKTTTEVTCEYYAKKRQQDSEHYIRDHPKQSEAIRLINDYIDKCVEPDYTKEKLFQCMLDLFKNRFISVFLDCSGETVFSVTDPAHLTYHHVSEKIETTIKRIINELPGIKRTPINPPTSGTPQITPEPRTFQRPSATSNFNTTSSPTNTVSSITQPSLIPQDHTDFCLTHTPAMTDIGHFERQNINKNVKVFG